LLGHEVVAHLCVGDSETDIIDSLEYISKRSDVVIVSGGLGPTVDDITLESASKFFGVKMKLSNDVWNEIQGIFKEIKRTCTENNKKQAYLPEGAIALENAVGTAPGVQMNCKGVEYFFVPGVPKEMKYIFEGSIYSWLKSRSECPGYYEKFLKCFGLPEATIDEMISNIDFRGVDLSFRVSFPEIWLKLVSRSKDISDSKCLVEEAALKIRKKLGDSVYGEGEETLESVVGNMLNNKGYKLVIAESCTGGLITHRVTNISGSSSYIDRGFVTYSNASKVDEILVKEDTIAQYGAVSPEVAKEMATGALKKSGADIAISVTGIAGPTGGTDEKPVGTVHIAIADNRGVQHQHLFFPRERVVFKELVASSALDMLRRYLA